MSDPVLVRGSELPYPASCATCGSPDRDCLDIGINIPDNDDDNGEGSRIEALLICTECFHNLASIAGYAKIAHNHTAVDPSEIVKGVENKLRRARNVADELSASLDIDLSSLNLIEPVLPFEGAEETQTHRYNNAAGQGSNSSILEESFGVPSNPSDEFNGLLASLK